MSNAYVELGGITAGGMKFGGASGGCGCSGKFLGGEELADNISSYEETANAKTVSDISRRIGGFVQGLTGGATTAEEQSNKISSLRLPTADSQRRATGAILETYEKAFGGCGLKIGGSDRPKTIDDLIEHLKSLNLGSKLEISGAKASVSRILKSMTFLSNEIGKYVSQIKKTMDLSAGKAASQSALQNYELFKATKDELDRQISIITQVLDAAFPGTEKELDKLAASLDDLSKLDSTLGSSEYRKKIQGLLFNAIGTVESSKLIESMLKKFGKSMSDYRSMKNISDLAVMFSDSVHNKSLSGEEAKELVKALDILTESFGRRDYVSEETKKVIDSAKTGGNLIPEMNGGNQIPDAGAWGGNDIPDAGAWGGNDIPDAGAWGGDEDNVSYVGGAGLTYKVPEKSETEKAIATKRSVRNIILQAFQRQLQEAFDATTHALHAIAIKIGTEIPLSDQLDMLRASLSRLNVDKAFMADKTLYLALIGYFTDVRSRSIKDEKVGIINGIISYCETIIAMKEYSSSQQYFSELASSLRNVIGVIDKYTEEVVSKFGAGESASAKQIAKMGGDDDNQSLAKAISSMPISRNKPSSTISDAITKFDYYYRSAQIRTNLSQSAQDIKMYGDKYEEKVANSIATILQEERNKYDLMVQRLKYFKDNPENIDHTGAGAASSRIDGFNPVEEIAAAERQLNQWWETKRKFWRTVEAVDQYMQAFTNGVVNNIDDVREIKSMLDEIPVVADIYSKTSGVHLIRSFESMYGGVDPMAGNRDKYMRSTINYTGSEHYYEQVARAEAARVPTNTGMAFVNIAVFPTDAEKVKKELKLMMKNLYFLKNLVSIFVHVGSKFGGVELIKKVGLSPTHIYDNLAEYVEQSSMAQGVGINWNGSTFVDIDNDINKNIAGGLAHTFVGMAGNVPIAGYAGPVPMGGGPVAINDRKYHLFHKMFGSWMRIVGDDHVLIETGLSWKFEDNYFVYMLKAMCAKIFTVVGTYDLLDRPLEYNGLSAIRMILGGDDSKPKVDPACMELYMRLPLLLEFYKKLFGYNSSEDYKTYRNFTHKDAGMSPGIKISMVPDIDGVFAKLIKIIFRDTRFASGQNYSDEDISGIISECNTIYQKMSSKYSNAEVVRKTINELVNEINRRYGVISANNRDMYEEDLGRQNYGSFADEKNPSIDDEREYSILPGEEESSAQPLSMAETLIASNINPVDAKRNTKYKIMDGHQKLLYNFRCLVEKELTTQNKEFSFANAIRVAKQKVSLASSDEDKFNIVCNLVRGKEITNARDDIVYLLFHETVVTGLNTLSALHSLLARFKTRALSISVRDIQDAIVNSILMQNTAVNVTFTELINMLDHGSLAAPAANVAGYQSGILAGAANTLANYARPGFRLATVIGAGGSAVVRPDVTCSHIAPPVVHRPLNNATLKSEYQNRNPTLINHLDAIIMANFDPTAMMRELIESLFGLAVDTQGMVDVKLNNNRLTVNYNKLKETIEELFQSVHYYIELMRPLLPQNFLYPYVDKFTPGSYYWLQEQINEKIMLGKEAVKIQDNSPKRYLSLGRVFESLDNTWQWLTGNFTLGPNYDPTAAVPAYKIKYGDLFAELVYYNANLDDSGIQPSEGISHSDSPTLVDVVNNPYEAIHLSGQQGQKQLDTRFIMRFKQLYNFGNELNMNRSMLFAFNQLVAKFIQQFYDTGSQKMYQGLVQSFTNGPFNRAIMDHNYTYPDVAPAVFIKSRKQEKTMTPSFYNVAKLDNLIPAATYEEILTGIKLYHKFKNYAPDAFDPNNDDLGSLVYLACVGVRYSRELRALYAAAPAAGANAAPLDTTALAAPALPNDFTNYNALLRDVRLIGGLAPHAGGRGFRHGLNLNAGGVNVPNSLDQLTWFGQYRKNKSNPAAIADFDDECCALAFLNAYTSAPPIDVVTYGPHIEGTSVLIPIHKFIIPVPPGHARSAFNIMIQAVGALSSIPKSKFDESYKLIAAMTKYLSDDISAGIPGRIPAPAGRPAPANVEEFLLNKINDIMQAIKTVQSIYIPRSPADPQNTIKLDDLYDVDKYLYGSPMISDDVSYLRMPTEAELPTFGGANSGVANKTTNSNDLKTFGKRQDPDGDHVLYTSLAIILRNIITAKSNNQVPVYLQESIADVSLYMKESMRACLPGFKVLFSTLSNKAEMLKHLTRDSSAISLERDFAGGVPAQNPWPFVLLPCETNSKNVKNRQHGILDSIVRGCAAIISSCDKVLNEIGDEPKFMELYQNSIKEYQQRYGNNPVMPISHLTKILCNGKYSGAANEAESNYIEFLPFAPAGSDSFKFLYGTRGIFTNTKKEIQTKDSPGFIDIMSLGEVGLTVGAADKKRMDLYHSSLVKLMKFVYEAKHAKATVSSYGNVNCTSDMLIRMRTADKNSWITDGLFTKNNMIAADNAPNLDITNKSLYSLVRPDGYASVFATIPGGQKMFRAPAPATPTGLCKLTYALSHTKSDIIQMVESGFREEKIKDIINYLAPQTEAEDNLPILNIIDLNIVPINVHALMREIPLANLYNYAYTFDRMLVEFYFGGKNDQSDALIRLLCQDPINLGPDNPRAVLAQFLLNPYGDHNNAAIDVVVGTMKNVDGLGRPKFLSDQLALAILSHHRAGMVDDPIQNDIQRTRYPLKVKNKNYIPNPSAVDPTTSNTANFQNAQGFARDYRRKTVLIRNLIFIVNLYRTMRIKLQDDLTYSKEVVQSAEAITKNSLTEFFGHEQYEGRDEEDWVLARKRRYRY